MKSREAEPPDRYASSTEASDDLQKTVKNPSKTFSEFFSNGVKTS
jgi:hypothetical protein